MGWSATKCLMRTGIPAATMAVGWTLVDIIRAGDAPVDALVTNILLYGTIWLIVSAFLWVATRVVPSGT